MTSVGVRFQDEQLSEKMPPCLTACPVNAFKSPGFYFMNETFYNQTYNKEEIFYETKKHNLSMTSGFTIEEVKGISVGRCYMVCPSKKLPRKDGTFFNFWKLRDIKGV